MKAGHVYLVGAGCGAADLITLRGLRALQGCQVVVYDDLIDPSLLEEVPADAERIYVGKRSGSHAARQEDINALLIRYAGQGKTVVRLKGGDPFVFGRGGEECLALNGAGIPCTEIPGISSAIAIPAEAGIPVTHRGLSRSVHIVTARTASAGLSGPELAALSHLSGTLVFLMGLHALPELTKGLVQAGKPDSTPAAVISGGNAAFPAAVRGTLGDIAAKTAQAGVQAPAVIVVGEVAALDLALAEPPLHRLRIGLTGTEGFQEKLNRLLLPLGAQTVSLQTLSACPLPTEFSFRRLCGGPDKWLVFTSAQGVELFFRRLLDSGMDARSLHRCRFAVIGSATGQALSRHGVQADLCPVQFNSAALGQALLASADPEADVFLFCSEQNSGELRDILRRAGRSCEVVPLYRLSAGEPDEERLGRTAAGLDYLVFGSSLGVRSLRACLDRLPAETVSVCIGPVTRQAFLDGYGRDPLVPETATAQGIADLILSDRLTAGSGTSPQT